jgi:hypothetical protein
MTRLSTSTQDRPAAIAGQSVAYLWKDIIRTGHYLHPTRGFRLDVDLPRLRRWASVGRRMLAAGIHIPANVDHSNSARDALGRILDFQVRGNALHALHQLIGDGAASLAARNQASVGIDPDFIDGRGRRWGEAIVHVALTPVPVVPGQGQFIQAASREPAASGQAITPAGFERSDVNTIACSSEQLDAVRRLIPGADDCQGDDLLSRLIEYLQSLAADDESEAGGAPAVASMSRTEIAKMARSRRGADRLAAEKLTALQEQLADRDQRIAELSARVPRPLDAEAQDAMISAIDAKKQLAIARGAITPAVADRLFAALVRSPAGKVNPIGLSRPANAVGDVAIGLAVFDALADNVPMRLGESSGVQVLSRSGADPRDDQRDRLTQRMIDIANAK